MTLPGLQALLGAIDSLGPVVSGRVEATIGEAVDAGLEAGRSVLESKSSDAAERVLGALSDLPGAIDNAIQQVDVGIDQLAKTAGGRIEGLKGELSAGLGGTIEQVTRSAASGFVELNRTSAAGRDGVESVAQDIRKTVTKLCEDTARDLKTMADDTRQRTGEAKEFFNELRKLLENSGLDGAVKKTVENALAALKAGAINMDEFLREFGDEIEVQLEGRSATIRQWISQMNADTQQFARDFRDLFDKVREESVSFDEALADLGGRLEGNFENIKILFEQLKEQGSDVAAITKQLRDFANSIDGPLGDVIKELLKKFEEERRGR